MVAELLQTSPLSSGSESNRPDGQEPSSARFRRRCWTVIKLLLCISARMSAALEERASKLSFQHEGDRHEGDRKHGNYSGLRKLGSCAALLFLTVVATLFAEASKTEDGTYPYNTFIIPCTVEALKLFASAVLLVSAKVRGEVQAISFKPLKFASFGLPALCYFVSNNCMFYIIRELGPTTFQITNNLKIISTGILMRIFLDRKLTWLQWKALVLLALGSCVTQLQTKETAEFKKVSWGYALVFINSFASGAGGVTSELLLKGNSNDRSDPIHWQNIQLYFFGFLFGLGSSWSNIIQNNAFLGFNTYAYATIISLTMAGLLVSFILKYLDNFVKCFVAAVAIVCVALVHGAAQNEAPRLHLIIGIILTCLALEQYNMPQ